MAAKLILSTIAATALLTSVATAQVQSDDDRFKPRVYGSTAITGADYGNGATITHTSPIANSQTTVKHDANVVRVTEPVTSDIQTTISTPMTYSDVGIVKAQHFKQGDLSDAEYNALLNEADRIRSYQSTHGSYTGISSSTVEAQAAPATESYEIELFAPSDTPAVTYAETTPITPTYSAPFSSVTHSVIKGDTLYNISKRYAVTIDALQTANNLSGNNIGLGQVLTIPSSSQQIISESTYITPVTTVSTSSPVTLVRNVEPIPGQSSGIYAVLPKDTLYSISRRACVSVGDLIATNGISNPNALKPGQRLTMPSGHCLN